LPIIMIMLKVIIIWFSRDNVYYEMSDRWGDGELVVGEDIN